MTTILKNKILQLALCCLCLMLFSFGLSQETSGTTDTTEETAVETTVDETEVNETNSDETEVDSETSVEESNEEGVREATADDVESEEALTGDTPSEESNVDAENTTETSESSEVVDDSDSAETIESTEEAADEATGSAPDDQTDNNANERVITVEYSGGNRKAVDFRYGPWIYSHPDEEGIVGTVGTDEDSQLTVYAKEAELKSPEDVLIATAGERVANFIGGVRVTRKRLTALGQELEYSEASGFGELTAEERVEITVVPKEEDGDLTEIMADSATFDVDTDVSVSRGGVTLTSGLQSAEAEEITFEQGLDLAVITSPDGQVTVVRSNDDGEVTITADTIRVLTETKKLMAAGNVTLVDGAITTTGDVVFFDDEIERAEVFGTPEELAVSIDSEFDVTLRGERLEQRIDLDLVEILDETVPRIWNEADFQLSSEMTVESDGDSASEFTTESSAEADTASESGTNTEADANSKSDEGTESNNDSN